MTDRKMSRRELLGTTLFFGAAASLGSSFLQACGGSGPTCTDTAGLSQGDVATRTANLYVDVSTDASKNCANCNFFRSSGDNVCGGCQVIKGPISPAGNCRLWAAKIRT